MDKARFKRIEVVAGLIFRRGKILVCQRKEEGSFPLKWEFPGGKIETGETPADALRRELKEELDIDVEGMTEVLSYEHVYPSAYEVQLRFFRIQNFTGAIQNLVFRQLSWVGVEELGTLDMLQGDCRLVKFLCSSAGSELWA
jgi:8-oxo-dGTP diphosphatase